MSREDTVLLGMSGGVDSNVSAWLLKRDGYRVIGVTLLFHRSKQLADKVAKAAEIAEQLGIEHHVIDARVRFAREVKAPFAEASRRWLRLNPCVRCSASLKIPLLIEQADAFGCDKVATGHYARITDGSEDSDALPYQLRCPRDRSKDQSFLLYELSQQQLERLVFPLADYSKPIVRRMAMQVGLQRISLVDDGQGTPCFFGEGGALAWLDGPGGVSTPAGDVLDITSRRVVGTHEGLHRYVRGQTFDELGTVVAADIERNELFVGPASFATMELAEIAELHWTSINAPQRRRSCRVRIAYDANLQPAQVLCRERGAVVSFTQPVSGLVAGQPLVFYSDDLVLGGGIVSC